MNEIQLGQYAVPFLITIFLAILFKPLDNPDGTSKVADWVKGYFALVIGIGLGIIAMLYKGVQPTFVAWVDYILYGLVQGAASIGIFKLAQFTPGVPISPPK
jgi:hypothetical protein